MGREEYMQTAKALDDCIIERNRLRQVNAVLLEAANKMILAHGGFFWQQRAKEALERAIKQAEGK